jgi:hypothetical protein
VGRFWPTYYDRMLKLHTESGKGPTEPIKDRNLGTTAAEHVTVLEDFCAGQLASAIGVGRSEVGKRKVKLAPHKSKSFDVCWPKTGEPRILISVKSMQNAYRNLTNRIEEACGDSAVLRLYRSAAVFGFFFFVLDGNVPRGRAEQGQKVGQGKKGVAPYLDLVEEGGDFFDPADAARYRRPPRPPPQRPPKEPAKTKTRQDAISATEMVLLDLAAEAPAEKASFLYDAIAYVPTRIRNKGAGVHRRQWEYTFTQVNERLDHARFMDRIVGVARLRGFLPPHDSRTPRVRPTLSPDRP